MPTERVAVVTRPDFDTATLYASYWVGKALRVLEELGLRVTDLFDGLAIKEKLVEAFEGYDPIAFWGVGHGNETQFAGQDAIIMIEKGVDETLFVERIVHLTSCRTGSRGGLLESIAVAGAFATIGYAVDFVVGIETGNFSDTPKNEASRSLLAPDVAIEVASAEGKTIVEALMRADEVSNAEIEYWRTSGHPDADLLIWAHINNRDGKVLYGLPAAGYRTMAEPLHPFTVVVGLSSLLSTGLLIIKWR